jgi:PGAP1-like protein
VISTVRPTVLVLGGFLTAPPLYARLADRLRARGAGAVVVAPLWTPHWILGLRGMGRVLATADRALTVASAIADRDSAGAPVLVVGHSAGGFLARLLTSPVPIAGLPLDRHLQIGTIVTLGTPHRVARRGLIAGRIERLAAAFADQAVPGACFAPEVGYVAVGSRSVVGTSRGLGRARLADAFYRRLHPEPHGSRIEGDGLVPLACTDLDGARWVVVEDVIHGQLAGRPWYGSEQGVDVWWPVALEAWRGALAARGLTAS